MHVVLEPSGIIGWILVGLIAGGIAARVVKWHRIGCFGSLFVGLAGSFVGGFLFSAAGFSGTFGTFGSMVIAFVGAVVLLALVQLLSGGRAR